MSRGRLLTVMGLLVGQTAAVVTESARVSWFDPSESCELRFSHLTDRRLDVTVRDTVFPPRSVCVIDGRSLDYMSPQLTWTLTVVILAALAMTLVGASRLGWALLSNPRAETNPVPGPPAATSSPTATTPVAGRRGVVPHLVGAGVVGIATVVVSRVVLLPLLLLTGVLGAVWACGWVLLAASATAAGLDRRLGPGTGSAVGSRRRGTVIGLVATGAILAEMGSLLGVGPLSGSPWEGAAVAAAACVGTVAVQWATARAGRPGTVDRA